MRRGDSGPYPEICRQGEVGRRTGTIDRRSAPRRNPGRTTRVRLLCGGSTFEAAVEDVAARGLRVSVAADSADALVRALEGGEPVLVGPGRRRTAAAVAWVGRSADGRVAVGLALDGPPPVEPSRSTTRCAVPALEEVRHRSAEDSHLARTLGDFLVETSEESFSETDLPELLCRHAKALTGADLVAFRAVEENGRFDDAETDPREWVRRDAVGAQLFVNQIGEGNRPSWLPWSQARSALIVPVSARDTDFGVLVCGFREEPFGFDVRLQREVGILAKQAALFLEKARTLRTLRESEQRYRVLVEHSPDAVAVHHDGRILYANAEAVRLFGGRSPADLVGRHVLDFVHEDSRPLAVERMRRLRETGEPQAPTAQKLVRLDGEPLDVEVTGIATVYAGRPAIQVVIRDVTDRKKAEAALRESEEKFRTIFHDGIDGITLNAESDAVYLDVNREFTTLTGWTREEVVGRTPRDIGIWGRREDFRAALREFAEKGFVRNLEARFRVKDGRELVCLYSGMRIEVSGRPCILSFVRDITERREAERELESSRQQLAVSEKLSALGRLVAGVAHEIRTPSAYIANNLFLIRHHLEKLAAADPSWSAATADLVGLAEVALEGVARIDRLVKDLRRVGRQEVEGPVEASLDQVVGTAVHLFQAAQRGQVEVETALEPTPALPVDRERIQQVVLNLLNNAADARGPKIRVATRAVSGGGEIEVEDFGTGIPPEVEARLFDPFFTTKAEGTGLGLSIARRIVEAHRGAIRYETRSGKGTRFVIFLPEGGARAREEANA